MNPTEVTHELAQLVSASGLEKAKQTQIAETLGAFFSKAAEWDATIKSISITSPEETGKMKMAREGRLTLKNMRLDAEKIVKAKRDELKYAMANFVLEDKLWLKAGQMIEATFKNLETKLEEKEKFAERWAAEQREKLKAERLAVLLPLGFQLDGGHDLGAIDEKTFQALKLGLEIAKKEKEDAERKAEEERIAREKAEAEERERIRIENEKLKLEAAAKEKLLAEEREAKEKLLAEIKAKADAEEKAKRDAEIKAAAEHQAEVEAAKAPKKQRLAIWVDSFVMVPPKGMAEDEIAIEIIEKFQAFKKWAKTKIEEA